MTSAHTCFQISLFREQLEKKLQEKQLHLQKSKIFNAWVCVCSQHCLVGMIAGLKE